MFELIEGKETSLIYFGVPTDKITANLIAIIENATKQEHQRKSMLRRMPILIAECFQNVIRHGVDLNENRLVNNYFQVQIEDTDLIISSSNSIENKFVKDVQSKIDLINSLSKQDLKSMRRELLMDGIMSPKGGAGLGLIEMAIKTEQNLQYRFTQLDEQHSQFFLVLTSRNNDSESEIIDKAYSEYCELQKEKVLLLYKGDLSWRSSSEVVRILEMNLFNEEVSIYAEKELSVIIEIIQNSAKHGLQINNQKLGVFGLRLENDTYSIFNGNYLSKSKAEILKNHLEKIDQASLEQLNELYKSRLNSGTLDEDGNAGLGLIEISRQTAKNFTYNIRKDDNLKGESNALFFSLEIELN